VRTPLLILVPEAQIVAIFDHEIHGVTLVRLNGKVFPISGVESKAIEAVM
jgi:hypothetical protein